MYVELLRYSIISPCKQYSERVFTFLVFVLPKLILTTEALNAKLWYRTKSPWLVTPRTIRSKFFPYCSLVVRSEKEFSLCLPGSGDWASASNWRQIDVFHERTPRKWIPIICYRNLSGARKLRNRMGHRMTWAGMLPRKLRWGRGARRWIGNTSPYLSCFHLHILLWIVTGMKWEVEEAPRRKLKVCSTQLKQQFQGQYSHVSPVTGM